MKTIEKSLSIRETCRDLGISKNTLHRLMKNEQINYFKIGSRTFFEPEEIRQFINARSTAHKPTGNDFDAVDLVTYDGELINTFKSMDVARRALESRNGNGYLQMRLIKGQSL